ncbi:MAG: class 1 fructose-bisphosphatase [Saprospiraceae bacterium]|nr:class 1 fructose-bisphosphatase [Lewinella sp.]
MSRQNLKRFTQPVGVTLDRFIEKDRSRYPYATGELSQLLRDIALAAKILNRDINHSGLIGIEGVLDSENIQGESQKMLDVIADIRFSRALRIGGETCCIVSEERDEVIYTGNDDAKYVVTIDPIDGSSNVNVNISTGTVFSIFRRKSPTGTTPQQEDILQTGRHQIVGGYILYGSSTMLVYTTGYGVNGFTYEPSLGEFYLSHPQMQIPENGKIYSVNEGNFYDFDQGIRDYLDYCKQQRLSARYVGSMIADFHRNLLQGGIYLYPATQQQPQGKLRLMYECLPLAYIAEQAGGLATNGTIDILDIQPESRHQRSPMIVGSKKMVEKALEIINEK